MTWIQNWAFQQNLKQYFQKTHEFLLDVHNFTRFHPLNYVMKTNTCILGLIECLLLLLFCTLCLTDLIRTVAATHCLYKLSQNSRLGRNWLLSIAAVPKFQVGERILCPPTSKLHAKKVELLEAQSKAKLDVYHCLNEAPLKNL